MKNYAKKSLKTSNGITLIALVITIIVLLILAGISISMLSGDNSILQKATEAKQTSERAEAKEQAQMDIMAYIADKTVNHQDTSLDDSKVKEILSDNKSYVKAANATSFITAKGEYEIPYSELYTANDKTPTVSNITGIDYGTGKTATTIDVGEDFTIGSESFRVLSTDKNTQIVAVPHYNITLNTEEPVQITDGSASSHRTKFANSGNKYWTTGQDDIDWTNEKCLIGPYVQAYSDKLNAATGNTGKVSARLGRYSEFSSLPTAQIIPNQEAGGRYWLGSGTDGNENGIYYVNGIGNIDFDSYYCGSMDSEPEGVRPVIVINLL